MTSLANIGPTLGFGGRAHVFEATTIEGKPIALKAYHTKHFCRNELGLYEYLKESKCHPVYLPQYHGPICLTPDNVRTIQSSIHDTRGDTATAIYRIGVGIERIDGPRLSEVVNDMTDTELKLFEKKMLAALLDLHKSVEICHKDIKADNILLPCPHTSRPEGFVIIDFSEAIIRRHTSDAIWKKACKDDIQALREIFRNARSARAVLAGCQLIQDATYISQSPSTSDAEIAYRLSDDLQLQLSHLLTSAQSDKMVSRLIDRILSTVTRPICQLALSLIRSLRLIGRFPDALHLVEDYVTAGSDRCDSTFLPSFNFQKAKILQSLGSGSVQIFRSAQLGFEEQLGANHITARSSRYELAVQHARSGDIMAAETTMAGLAKSIVEQTSRTRKEDHLLQKLVRLRHLLLLRSSHNTNLLASSPPTSGSKT